MNGFVYRWDNIKNGKSYIGSHKGNINDSYIGSGVYFKRAYLKNPSDFKREILYVGDKYLEFEDKLLKLYNVSNNNKFYNLKNDAVGGWEHCHTDEIKKKRAKALSKAKKGISPACGNYDKSGSNNPMYGKKHSSETKRKIALKSIGKKRHQKKVIEITSQKIFDSVKECAEYYAVKNSTMTTLIRNEKINRGKCKNKIFKYV